MYSSSSSTSSLQPSTSPVSSSSSSSSASSTSTSKSSHIIYNGYDAVNLANNKEFLDSLKVPSNATARGWRCFRISSLAQYGAGTKAFCILCPKRLSFNSSPTKLNTHYDKCHDQSSINKTHKKVSTKKGTVKVGSLDGYVHAIGTRVGKEEHDFDVLAHIIVDLRYVASF